MNIFLVSYGNLEYNGRLRELINVFSEIGNLFYIARATVNAELYSNLNNYIYEKDNYMEFICKTVEYAKTIKNKGIDIIVIDDRKAVVPGRIAKHLLGAKIVIQDCRELYTIKDVHHLSGKIGCIIEKPAIKKADILICANPERADFMKEYYRLKEKPISYENIRKLEYSKDVDIPSIEKKYRDLVKPNEVRVLTTAGCRLERTNDILVKNMRHLSTGVRLIIVGEDAASDRKEIEKIIKESGIENITILGRLNQDELKYVTQKCHIGVVNYHQNDLNNKYCASGKLYEFLFEGLPIITTTNPPLKKLCEKYGIGIADDNYYRGIRTIIDDYAMYKKNVKYFIKDISVKSNNEKLVNQLKIRLREFV
jgi:hypothetical protein